MACLGWVAVLALGPLPSGQAQPPPDPVRDSSGTIDFSLVPETTLRFVTVAGSGRGPGGQEIGPNADFRFTIKDLSTDAQSLNPAADARTVNYHVFTFDIGWLGGASPGPGWTLAPAPPTIAQSLRGETYEGFIVIQSQPTNAVRTATANMRIVMCNYQQRDICVEKQENFTAIVYPSPALQARIVYDSPERPGAPNEAPPNALVTIPVEVQNTDLYVQKVIVQMQVAPGPNIDPAQIPVIGNGPYVLQPGEIRAVNLTILTPRLTTWYYAVPLIYTVVVTNAQEPSIRFTVEGALTVDGFYFSEQLLIMIPILLLLLVLFLLAVLAGKRFYDENILGKPVPPWRIPQEARALNELRKTNPREFYITRYFLMVEEYESALNWFYSYKARTKREIKKATRSERLAERAAVLRSPSLARFDRRAARIRARTHRRQERRRLKLEARLTKLQRKVDQHYEEDHEKDHEKWEKRVEKLKRRASKPWFKAHKKWEREVEAILDEWEKPFAKEKAKRDKEIAKAKGKYAALVKKKDKDAWRDSRDAIDTTEKENKIRKRQGDEPLPLPELVSNVVGPPELPAPFRPPPKPRLPAEPKEPEVEGLPPEPTLEKPRLEASHYANKAKRAKRKTERKIRRLEHKLERLLAKNERDRVRAIHRAGRKRERLLRKSQRVVLPTLVEKLFRTTPEDRERRAHKKLIKALARERIQGVEESERTRLEVVKVDAQRREAELVSRLVRTRAEVAKGAGSPALRVDEEPQIVELREQNARRLEREEAAAETRVAAERERIERELREKLTDELVQERTAKAAARDADRAARLARALAKESSRGEEPTEKAEKPPRPRRAKK